MRLLTTFLAVMATCTVILIGAGLWIDAPRHEMQSTGLTAATVLGIDAMPSLAPSSTSHTVAAGAVDIRIAAGDEG